MRFVRGFLALVLLAVPVVLAFAGHEALRRYELAVMPYLSSDEARFVEIPPGSRAVDAIEALVAGGVLRDSETALLLLRRSGKARSIRAGEYFFQRPLAPAEVLDRLVEGDVFLRRITIPEGLHRYEIASRFERLGFGSAEAFLAASADPGLILDLDPEAESLDGYLFPDTYSLARSDDAGALVRRMVAGFRAAVGDDPLARAEAGGRSLREVVILAALVEKETARADERGLVAGVYAARLRKRMLLQADPTVIYGLILDGRWTGDLKRTHLREDAPYNTYRRAGLPPGPIANPGKAALDAAFQPADTDFLYFVSKNDGSHVFSRNLREHNRNVNIHQRQYWRKKWREAGGRKKYLESQKKK